METVSDASSVTSVLASVADAYLRDGVVVMRGALDDEYVQTLRSGWRALTSSFESNGLRRDARFVFGLLPPPVGMVWQHPTLIALVREIIGPDVALYMNRVLIKDEHWTGAISIHQDMPYFNGGQRKVSIFVPLERTQADGGNGGLKFVVGSHRYGNLERGTINLADFEPMPVLAPDLDVGDVVVMDFLTWHYSETPATPSERPLLQLAYQAADDGSYGGELFGVAAPTLVAGSWRTRHFAQCRKGVIPDAG